MVFQKQQHYDVEKTNNHHRRHQSVKFSPLYYDKYLLLLLRSSSKTASMPPNLRANSQQQQNNATSRSASASASSVTRKKKSNRRERQRANSNNNERADLEDYIPPYLHGAGVHFYHGDFCFARSFHPQLVVQCLAEGFLTIACSGGRILLPKLHEQRSVVRLRRRHKNDDATSNDNRIDAQQTEQQQQQEPLHVPRSIRKKAGKFFLTLNQRFDDVVQGCRTQHGHHCWLYDTLVEAFRVLHQKEGGVVAHIPQQQLDDEAGGRGGGTTILSCPVQVVSVEIWQQQQVSQNNNDDYDDDNDKKRQAPPKYQLVAGELGYTVGTMYTSLTGFSAVDSAGSVQLSVTGRVLQAAGFTWWDLGMSMPYKAALGAQELSRHNFVAAVHECRKQTPLVNWMQPYQVAPAQMIPNQHNCRFIIDATAGKIMDCT